MSAARQPLRDEVIQLAAANAFDGSTLSLVLAILRLTVLRMGIRIPVIVGLGTRLARTKEAGVPTRAASLEKARNPTVLGLFIVPLFHVPRSAASIAEPSAGRGSRRRKS